VKFTWNFCSQTLRLLFYVGILSIKAIEGSRAIKNIFSNSFCTSILRILRRHIILRRRCNFIVYLLRRMPTPMICKLKYSETYLLWTIINGAACRRPLIPAASIPTPSSFTIGL